MSKAVGYKSCIVPFCENIPISNPGKHFFSVPKGEKRKAWLRKVKRDEDVLSFSSAAYCCEDHFNVTITDYLTRYNLLD